MRDPASNTVRSIALSLLVTVSLALAPQAIHAQDTSDERPRAAVRVQVEGGIVSLDALGTTPAAKNGVPIVSYEWRAHQGNAYPLVLASLQSSLEREPVRAPQVQLRAPPIDGEYLVTLRATDSLGRADESTAVFRVTGGKPSPVDVLREHPRWVDSAVIYGVAPFFFGKQDFESVRARVDEIAALGATVIWLSPVTGTAPDDFGYAVTDHFRLRNTFGTEKQFRALIDAAHAHGLRVIMDFVPNHFASHHPYFRDAERRRDKSPYFDWFARDAEGRVTHYFDWNHLMNLNYDNPDVRQYMLAAFSYWVREFKVDGFRVDAAWGVRERRPEFWPTWRAELKRIDPDLLLLAEASGRDPYYLENGFDAAYDWTSKLGEWAWQDIFSKQNQTPDLNRLREALVASATETGAPSPFRFFNNNDTGPRFITRHGLPQTRLAATMLFTLPGMPLIYNGDEVGAVFQPYDEGPPIDWRDKHGLVPLFMRLTQLRRDYAELRSGKLTMLSTDHEREVLAYQRGDRTVVLLNFSAKPVTLSLQSVPAVVAAGASTEWQDLLAATPAVRIQPASSPVQLDALSARLLVPYSPENSASSAWR